MKKQVLKCMIVLTVLFLLGGLDTFSEPQQISLEVYRVNPVPSTGGPHKKPVDIPLIWQDGYQIGFPSEHAEYTIELVQEGTVVYSTLVSESTSSIMLPSWLEGEYELHLIPADSSYYFFGYISL